jgi:methylamine dehydrogenase accessory protein MauD
VTHYFWEFPSMNTALFVAAIVLSVLVLSLGFLVLGTLRALGLVNWRLDQLELTRPSRLGRDGLKVGKKAPDFTLASATNGDVSLHDYVGRKVLLVFTQTGCGPCHDIAPELNRLHDKGEYRVLVVNNGEVDDARNWAIEAYARFPVLGQEKFDVSKRYEVFATPFAFLIDEHGVVASKGIVTSREHFGFLLEGRHHRSRQAHAVGVPPRADLRQPQESLSLSHSNQGVSP